MKQPRPHHAANIYRLPDMEHVREIEQYAAHEEQLAHERLTEFGNNGLLEWHYASAETHPSEEKRKASEGRHIRGSHISLKVPRICFA